jgi:hypothetical protein
VKELNNVVVESAADEPRLLNRTNKRCVRLMSSSVMPGIAQLSRDVDADRRLSVCSYWRLAFISFVFRDDAIVVR